MLMFGFAYYSSPAAAGFFAGNHKDIQPGGRFDNSVSKVP